jgi:ABC-type transport system involved in cytochrome bd biosynthesis fused ATPase/permease subunit
MMDKIIEFSNLIRTKKIFPAVKYLLNFLFVVNIASFLFENLYFKYELLDISNYKIVYNFFVKGSFAIPLTLFFLVWVLTYSVAILLFSRINKIVSNFFRNKIDQFENKIKKDTHLNDQNSDIIRANNAFEEKYGENWFELEVAKIKSKYSKADLKSILLDLKKIKFERESEFIILFRGFIAVSIFFATSPDFGTGLFVILIFAFFICLIVLILIFQFMELIPYIINKIKQHLRSKNEINSSEVKLPCRR